MQFVNRSLLMVALVAPRVAWGEEGITLESRLDGMVTMESGVHWPQPEYTCRQTSSHDRQEAARQFVGRTNELLATPPADGRSVVRAELVGAGPRSKGPRFLFGSDRFVTTAARAADDILIADFEGVTYGDWKAEGEAFGTGPARGTLPNQMEVSGFQGKGLVNTYLGGDAATGTLTSPEFTIERDYITFLIGGGSHAGTTCMELLVDGTRVCSATGPALEAELGEMLDWRTWDVRGHKGAKAVIRIVDAVGGRWGHVNVDQIAQSDTPRKRTHPGLKRNAPLPTLENPLEVALAGRYLIFPVANDQAKRGRMTVIVGDELVHSLECDFPQDEAGIDWWGWLDVSDFKGRTARIDAAAPDAIRRLITTSDEIKSVQPLYDEPLRPQFHLSQMRGWNNDPNGMVHYDGEYHLFWQSNPGGWLWNNMYWGHATSPDMVHWTEHPHALRPWGGRVGDRHPSMADKQCFSGSAHVDIHDTAGWQKGGEKTLVAAFTDTGCGECLAYSNDRGRTWTYYEGNPIIRHPGRDPRLIWYEPGKHWVIAVYDETQGIGRNIAIYTSTDLKEWKLESHLPGYYECAELFELPVDGDPTKKKWVIFAADSQYAIGSFDGRTFTPEHEGKRQVHWGAYYASQCFSNAPDGRIVQVGWARINMPDMPFNQTFSLPTNLSLRTTKDGVRMFAEPVAELATLRKPNPRVERGRPLTAAAPALALGGLGQCHDIEVVLTRSTATKAVLRFGRSAIAYDFVAGTLDGMPLAIADDGRVTFRVLVDRPMIEIVGGGGACYKTMGRPDAGRPLDTLSLTAEGGDLTVESLTVHEMGSIWKKN